MTEVVLAVDVGTSSLKSLLVDATGRVHGRTRHAYPTRTPRPGWAEQDPDDWWRALRAAVDELAATCGEVLSRVTGVALTGQSPGVVLVDAAGSVVRPCLIWADRRAVEQSAMLAEAAPPDRWRDWVGFAAGADAGLRPAKLRWLVENEPEAVATAHRILQPKDYLFYRLTGEFVIDEVSMRGSALDHRPGPLWDLIGVDPSLLPDPVPVDAAAGTVSETADLPALQGRPVVPGTFDGLTGVIGCGPQSIGHAVNVAGSSQIVGVAVENAVDAAGLSILPLWAGGWLLGGPTQSGGVTLAAAARTFGFVSIEELERRAAGSPRGARGLLYLPFPAGERTPYWDRNLRAGLVGLDLDHGETDIARAIIEGHAAIVADIVERAGAAADTTPTELRCGGGMSVSQIGLESRAWLTGTATQRTVISDVSCVGVAVLAARALGWHETLPAAIAAMVRLHPPVEVQRGGEAGAEVLARFRRAVTGMARMSGEKPSPA